MIFKRIVLHNFGLYKGKHEINLEPPSLERPIILFGGLNGGGKTTFLTAIQLALYGKFSSSVSGNKSYEKVLTGFINRDINPSDGAAIELELQHFVDGEVENIEIFRSWRKSGKSISETLEVRRNGQDDPAMADRWYELVEGLIPSRLSHLFFFDGEKIESLADQTASSQFLKAGLHDLLGLDLVSTLISDLKVNERRKLIRGVDDNAFREELSKAESVVKELNDKKESLVFKRGEINNRLDQISLREKKTKEKYRTMGGDLLDQRESILAEGDRLTRELHHIDEQLREIAAGPAPLLLVKDLIGEVFEQAQKEQETIRQKAVIETLMERDHWVLQAMQDQKQDSATLERLSKLFVSDRMSREKVADQKIYLNVNLEDLAPFGDTQLEPLTNRIRELTNHRDLVETRKTDQDRLLEGMPDPEGLEGMTAKLAEMDEQKIRIEIEQNLLEEEIDSNFSAIERAEANLERVQAIGIESEFNSERLQRIIVASGKAKVVLKAFQQRLAASHVKRLEKLILSSFQQVLRKKTLVDSIEICPDSYQVKLLDSGEKDVPASSLSAGERQLLAVAILWGLAKASGRGPIPTIVDTPLGRLDGSHRLKLVENYFPQAAHQVILLSTDEEISGELYEKLKPAIGHEYMLTFNEDTASTEVSEGYEFRGAA